MFPLLKIISLNRFEKLHGGVKIYFFQVQQVEYLTCKNKVHIFEPLCNFVFTT